jgi:hypothetical protein
MTMRTARARTPSRPGALCLVLAARPRPLAVCSIANPFVTSRLMERCRSSPCWQVQIFAVLAK